MSNWREQKRKALGYVHRQFQIPAVYLTHTGGNPVAVRVRLHRKNELANASGEDFGLAASNMVLVDRIIFDVARVSEPLVQTAYVIFSRQEGYITGPISPVRDGYASAEVSVMQEGEIEALLLNVDTTLPIWADIA